MLFLHETHKVVGACEDEFEAAFVGADGNNLIGLAPYWAPLIPDAEFLSPHAPFPCDMAPYGRQWFSLQDRSPGPILAGVRAA